MTKIDKYVSVLWISDIHWSADYLKKSETEMSQLESFLGSFRFVCEEKIKNSRNFDYIVITGDLANRGEKGEYEQLYEKIIKPIIEICGAPLILVPGNHDLDRKKIKSNTVLLDKFIQEVKRDDIILPDKKGGRHFREVFFEENKTEFFNTFETYSLFCKEQFKTEHENIEYNSSYRQHGLFGYVLDKKTKLIYIIFNSAWYSFGEVFIEHYIQPDKKFSEEEIDTVRKRIALITNEYGKQILGLDLLDEIDKLLELINTYPEFLIINLMHHPINWLIKHDQIPNLEYNFSKIMEHVDILLTGHEHVLRKHPIKFINNGNTLHLEAGAFMRIPKKEDLFSPENNWFSILDINITKRTLNQTRIIYDSEDCNWVESESLRYKLNKKHYTTFSVLRKKVLVNAINLSALKFLSEYFAGRGLMQQEGYCIDKYNDIYYLEKADMITISADKMLEIVEKQTVVVSKIYFVFVDLFHTLALQYSEPKNNRLLTINEIKQDYDLKFDAFRYNFFSQLSEDQAIKYSKVMLLSKIIPFWDIEHFYSDHV